LLLTIDKMIYGGDGLARLPASSPNDEHGRGKAVFVPFVLAGEKIEATLNEQKSGFARAHADAVTEPSSHRVSPACPYFTQCGGCHYQHTGYEHQLEIKKEILRETLRRTAKLDLPFEIQTHPSPPWNYRNRSRLQVETKPNFAAGYFRTASHNLLPVESCPISSPLINRGIAALWKSGRSGKVPEGVREIEFFANADDTQLLVELQCSPAARRAAVRIWAEDFRAALPEIAGIAAFRESQSDASQSSASRSVASQPPQSARVEALLSLGSGHLTYRTDHSTYRVSAGSFFQTNRHLTDKLVQLVTAGRSGDLVLDLYAGVGLFSTALAGDFRHIVSVESSQHSSADLAYNLPSNGKAVQATTEQYLARAENSRRSAKGEVLPQPFSTPDLVVVDPPRSGLGERVARQLANLRALRVTYVSCDPPTLARDLVPLLAAGYHVEQAHLVDLFPQTFHIETVVQLLR
jgi:23S rRNA (uracil1939-C5)-methyltransferase